MADKILKGKIVVKNTEITVLSVGDADDYISLTDVAKSQLEAIVRTKSLTSLKTLNSKAKTITGFRG